MSAGYQKDFERAEKTFVYQRVFHRSSTTGQTRMVTLTPITGQGGIEEEDCIGPMLPDALVEAVSRGEVDPITKLPIVDLNPSSPARRSNSTPSTISSSFYAAPKPKWIRETKSAGQKTLDTFFARGQTAVVADTAARPPLRTVTNVAAAPLATGGQASTDVWEKAPDEKSRYFASATMTANQSSPDLRLGESAHLATFTPTQVRRRLSRCSSTESGEISSPASCSRKRASDQLQSSPPS